MAKGMKRKLLSVCVAAAAGLLLAAHSVSAQEDKDAELKRVSAIADELLPKVAEATGLEAGEAVKIDITNKTELREFLFDLLEEEFPGDELENMTRCFVAFGLLPADYDARQGLVDLLQEQAGAFYDPRTKTFWSIIDLPDEYKIPMMEKMMIAHELTHALQDRKIDIRSMQKKDKANNDAAYAHSAVMEGMASVVMIAAVQGLPQDKLPDMGRMIRMSLQMAKSNPLMKTFVESPRYMQEMLMSPYAEGSSFYQTYLKENPDKKGAELLGKLPESSEQILHYKKYRDNDIPSSVDLSGLEKELSDDWKQLYSNVLGEFDVKIMFKLNGDTADSAGEIAAGWDGVRFSAFAKGGDLLIAGSSIWDSENDAVEFADGFQEAMEGLHGKNGIVVERLGTRVSFLIGSTGEDVKGRLMKSLMSAPAVEQ